MTGILNLLAGAVGVVKDTYFNLVTLLLPGNGTNGAQNNTFLDSSTNNFTITRNGNTTQGTFSPFSQTGWSAYNASTGSGNAGIYLGGQTDFAFGTGDFTIEFWIYLSSSGQNQVVYDCRPPTTQGLYPTIYLNNSTTKLTYFTNSADRITQTSTFTYNTWHHVVVTRTGTSTKMFVDGTQEGSTYTDSNNYINGTDRPFTGDGFGATGATGMVGYMSNLRVVKGSGPYQSAGSSITVPTSPLTPVTNTVLLTLQSNRYVDTNTQVAAKTITTFNSVSIQAFSPFAPTAAYSAATNGGSGYFDGTGDYLSVGAAADWAFLNNTTALWSIEGWFYNTTTGSQVQLFDTAGGTTNNVGVWVAKTSSETIRVSITRAVTASYVVDLTTTGKLVANSWNHLLITYDQSLSTQNLKIYINGAAAETGNKTANAPSSSNPAYALSIGTFGAGGGEFYTGYFGSLRISNVVRSSGIPTSPYTSDANTKLLTNFTNAGITDATAKNDLETVGNAQISTTQSKFGGSSMYFDGTGDALYLPSSQNLSGYDSGNWTIEAWVYPTETRTQAIINLHNASNNNSGVNFGITNTNQLKVDDGLTAGASGGTVSTNTWTHVAAVRSGTTITLYVNGTSVGTTTQTPKATQFAYIGRVSSTTVLEEFKGYIDDLRITKGYARYTSNFTPPTAPFALQ